MSKEVQPATRSTIMGTTRYEFLMQVRRPALWIVMFLFMLWTVATWFLFGSLATGAPSLVESVASWSLVLQTLIPIAFGVLLANRLPRDGKTRMRELLEALPASPGGHLLGKYLGSTLATLVPVLFVHAIGVGIIVFQSGSLMTIPLGILTFLAINLPGLLFVAAFSVSVPAVLWVPLYQFLFVGYWFWGNLIPTEMNIPTIAGTWLMPRGENMASGFFGTDGSWIVRATPWEGLASMSLLLGLSALALLCVHYYLRWQQARQ